MGDAKRRVCVGTRKSQLALLQTRHVIAELEKTHKDVIFEIVEMSTIGDKILDIPLSKIGEKALFTKELEKGLESGDLQMVVHSLKDLPTVLLDGMTIGAVLKREDPFDAVVMSKDNSNLTLSTLPVGSEIGTSSLRRAAQLKSAYPSLVFTDIRGNLNTRLRKLDEGSYAALVLANAGLRRMGWHDRVSQVLSPDECLYAVCQGALAVECRDGDMETLRLLQDLNDQETLIQCVAERSFLNRLEGGCSVPVGISCVLDGSKLSLDGAVFSIDGSESVRRQKHVDLDDMADGERPAKKCPYVNYTSISYIGHLQQPLKVASQLGRDLADLILEGEGREILAEAKRKTEIEIRNRQKSLKKLKEEVGSKEDINKLK